MKKLCYCFCVIILLISCNDDKIKDTLNRKENIINNDVAKDSVTNNLIINKIEIPLARKEFVQDSTKYYLFFTFDDGPQLPGSSNCREILDEMQVKGSFFMVGKHSQTKKGKEFIESLKEDTLCYIANHSNVHANNKYKNFYSNPTNAKKDFLEAQEVLNIPDNKIIRFPGRNIWLLDGKISGERDAYPTARQLDSLGFSVLGWDIEWHFINGKTPLQSADKMVQQIQDLTNTKKPNAIVFLTHDRMFSEKNFKDSLRKVISILKNDKKYVFETVDNYLRLRD